MAKEKVRIVYREKFKKGVSVPLSDVKNIIKNNKKDMNIEILDRGKMSDDSDFVSFKFIVK